MRAKDIALYGKPVACKDCGGSFDTLVKTGENEYRHEWPGSCEAQRRRDKLAEAGRLLKEKLSAIRRPVITAGVRAKRTKSWPRTGTKRTESGLILPQ